MHLAGLLPHGWSLRPSNFSSWADFNYLGGKPAWNLTKNLGITNGVLLMPYMRQVIIKDMACPDVSTSIGPLVALEQVFLCVEGAQHIFILMLILTSTKNIEDLAVTRQSVWVLRTTSHMIIYKLQGWQTLCGDGHIVDKSKPKMTPYL